MRAAHARFRGISGTCAHFGDSLTVSQAYWAPLSHVRIHASPELEQAYDTAAARLVIECWRDWKGTRFGSQSGAGIAWAHENIGDWLKRLNPETAIILFGTNDVQLPDLQSYEDDLKYVLQRCLDNGTVPLLTTIPPRRDAQEQVEKLVAIQRELSRELHVPLIDLHAEILQRRPDDWDLGPLPADAAPDADPHDVETLIAADGIHLSYPSRFRGNFSEESLNSNGYALRSAITLLAYADVVNQVFLGKAGAATRPRPAAQNMQTKRPVPRDLPTAAVPAVNPPSVRGVAERFSTHYAAWSPRFEDAPRLTDIPLPELHGAYAVWGATGRDDIGNIFIGVSTWNEAPSSHLLKLSDGRGAPVVVGDVMGQLARTGEVHTRESQNKIHSKICQAADGCLYFASMDETGEAADGSKLPIWGGHLWRIRPGSETWEHLLKTPEALIAVSTTGRYVYALGYFNHVLYQFDTATGQSRSLVVGSQAGHISRNFLVDLREHVYVPRVEALSATSPGDPAVRVIRDRIFKSWLVEFDPNLKEVTKWPLPDYDPTPDSGSHGIVGYAGLRTGQIVFTTHSGAFWCLTPATRGPAILERLGWFHPNGRSYPTSLYCPSGDRFVCGLTGGQGSLQWVVHDLETWKSRVVPLDPDSQKLLQRPRMNIYGTNTLDNQSCGYLVGNGDNPWGPFVLRVEWPEESAKALAAPQE